MYANRETCVPLGSLLRQSVASAKMRYPPICESVEANIHISAVYLDAGIMSGTNRGTRLHNLHLTEKRTWKRHQPRVSEYNCCTQSHTEQKKRNQIYSALLTFHTYPPSTSMEEKAFAISAKASISIKLLTVRDTDVLRYESITLWDRNRNFAT